MYPEQWGKKHPIISDNKGDLTGIIHSRSCCLQKFFITCFSLRLKSKIPIISAAAIKSEPPIMQKLKSPNISLSNYSGFTAQAVNFFRRGNHG